MPQIEGKYLVLYNQFMEFFSRLFQFLFKLRDFLFIGGISICLFRGNLYDQFVFLVKQGLFSRVVFGSKHLCPFKHHVFKQVGNPGDTGSFVHRTNLVINADTYDGDVMLFQHEQLQTVFEDVFLYVQLQGVGIDACGEEHG